MKKESIILWIASFVCVFLVVYISNLIGKDYPITSTIEIEGKKVSYRFEKVHYGKDDYKVIIRTDLDDLKGKLFWKSKADTIWNFKQLQKSDLILTGDIPALKPAQSLFYFVVLDYKREKYIIPDNQKVRLTFFGKISDAVNILKFLLLYSGLVLAFRTGFEYFNNGRYTKKFGVLTVIIFLTLIALVNPLYLTYKFGFLNSSIPPIYKLFVWRDSTIFILWSTSLITIFRSDKFKSLPLVSAVLTLIIVVFING